MRKTRKTRDRLYRNLIVRPRWRRIGVTSVFTEHYRNNYWKSPESRSGMGSTLLATEIVRDALPKLLAELHAGTILDIPCGDFNWMKLVDLNAKYIGADIVEDLIEVNRKLYSSESRSFVRLNLLTDPLPQADLILCRDCLFHLSFQHIEQALSNLKRSNAAYLLTTTNPSVKKNRNIATGEWRRLNLQAAPFSLPQPLRLIDEQVEGKFLGLWRISDL